MLTIDIIVTKLFVILYDCMSHSMAKPVVYVFVCIVVPVVSCGAIVLSLGVLVVGDGVLVVGDGVLVVGDGVGVPCDSS